MEYKKEKMVDQHHVKDNHQEGIKRVLQRKGDLCAGQGGKMDWKGGHEKGSFKRHGEKLTPRKA